ncbi:hypothetical protein TRICI_003984 [Trichomonascus ciferrii]|uniref:Uncharacterized protein n=1 Tax=Trichomonascus ciferrii TaxID=44093 RepID=A0A642V1N2_9ASCO|nr:hypothetical protein TRICI_003984 [Trichomonascus ciferrii]
MKSAVLLLGLLVQFAYVKADEAEICVDNVCRYVEGNGISTDDILTAAINAAEKLTGSSNSIDKAAEEVEIPDVNELMSADFIVTNSNGLNKIMDKLYEDEDSQPNSGVTFSTTLTASFTPIETSSITDNDQISAGQGKDSSDNDTSSSDVDIQSSTSPSSSTSSNSDSVTSGGSQSSSGQCSADCSALHKITGQSGGKQSSYGGGTSTKSKEVYSVCIKDHCIEEKTCNGKDCSGTTTPACEICSLIGLSDQFCSDCSNKRMQDVLESVKSTCGCTSPGLG